MCIRDRYKDKEGLTTDENQGALAVCSLGDASVTEGEIAEAFQMAALKQLPMLFLVQDNGCLLYTSDAADERSSVDLVGRRIIKKKTTYNDRVKLSSKKKNKNK